MCEIRHVDYCFYVEAKGLNTMNMNAARWLCERKNAKLGNVYDSEHFNKLTEYYRPLVGTRLDRGSAIGIKTGMIFDKQAIVSPSVVVLTRTILQCS